MAEHVCPWWIGYQLARPVRRWLSQSPEEMLRPFVRDGITVLEPGPGMGFFTLPLARMAGSRGREVAVDIQPQILSGLRQRVERKGVAECIETRLAGPDQMGLDDLAGAVDFALAFAVVHEMLSADKFFRQVGRTAIVRRAVWPCQGHRNSSRNLRRLGRQDWKRSTGRRCATDMP
jgi:hypothetical protein